MYSSEPGLACANDRLSAVSDLEFVKDVGKVVAHGFGAEHQALCNLSIVVSLSQQQEDFPLALGQFRKRLRWCGQGFGGSKVANQAFGNGWTEDGFPATDGLDRSQRLVLVGAFEQVAARTSAHGS